MARLFNSSTHSVTCSVGAFSGAPFTYGMQAAILRWSAVAGWMEYYTNGVASGDLYFGIEISANRLVCSFDGSTQCTSNFTPSQDVWYCVICTKATGTAAPRWNIYNYSTNSWTTSVADNAGANGAGNMGSHYLGSYQGGFEFFAGHIAAMGLFRQVVPSTDAEIQALGLPFDRNAWFKVAGMADRAAFWMFDQSATSMPVRDLTGGGANESGGTPPSLGTLSVPLFSYGAPISNSPPGVAASGNYTDDVTTTGTAVTEVTDVHVTVPKFKSAGTPTENIANSTVAWPTHVAGDVALLLMESAGGEAITLTNAEGFTQVANSPSATGTGTAGTRLTAYWHRATSSSMNAPAFADAGNHVYGVILTFTDCISTGNPIDITAAAVKASASTSMTMPGVTTTVNRALICNCASRDNDNAAAAGSAPSNGNLANLTERFDLGTALGNGGGLMVWCGEKAAAGATGDTTATVTSSINAYLTIALKGNQPTGGTAYTDDVTTTITAVTSETDLKATFENVETTGVAVTSSSELLALIESVLSTAVVDTFATDVAALVDSVQTNGVGVTELTDVAAMNDDVSTTAVGVTSLDTDRVDMAHSVQTDVTAETTETDLFSYNENVVTTIVSSTSLDTETLASIDDVVTVVAATTEITNVAGLNDNVTTTGVGTTTVADSLGGLEETVTTVVGVTSEIDALAMTEAVQTDVTTATQETDTAAFTDATESTIVGVTEVTDQLNGEEPPPEPVVAYQVPPWKVIGYR